ncbi:MAG TPA: methyltransferase domain-containing protein [Gemmatimonadaceae bacterium]
MFVLPSRVVFSDASFRYRDGCATYGDYNYLRPGLVPRLKRYRFEVALQLAAPRFHETGAIDMGCADGVLLPSLAKYFKRVAGIDRLARWLVVAQQLVDKEGLTSVRLLDNSKLTMNELKEALGGEGYGVLFLLETIEHVADAARPYESRVEFIRSLFTLLDPGGTIVLSMPKMVGAGFALKYLIQAGLRMHHEKLTTGELANAVFRRNTDSLEPRWSGGHLGFNDLSLLSALKREFRVVRRRNLVFSEVLLLEQR